MFLQIKDPALRMKVIKIVGLLLILMGFSMKTLSSNYDDFMETFLPFAIVTGFLIFINAVFGCIGAITESICLVKKYVSFLAFIVLFEISVWIAAFISNALRSNIEESIEAKMLKAMEHFDMESNAFTWNYMQYNLKCCGIRNNTDWNRYADRNFGLVSIVMDDATLLNVPATCCEYKQCFRATDVYTRGCLLSLSYVVSIWARFLTVGLPCLAFTKIMGFILAPMLVRVIRKVKS